MDQTVALLAVVVALLGTAIGLRFQVLALIPAALTVLITSVMVQLLSNKMAGWGMLGAVCLLLLLNAGFALGLLLRAAVAYRSTKRIARLFARPGKLDHQMRRPEGTGSEASSEGPAATIPTQDLAKGSFRQ